jgi:hypothetical protein
VEKEINIERDAERKGPNVSETTKTSGRGGYREA